MRGHLVEEVRCPWRHFAAVVDWLHTWPGGASYEARHEDAAAGFLAVFTLEPEVARAAREALAVEWLPASSPRIPWEVVPKAGARAWDLPERPAVLRALRMARGLSFVDVQRLSGLSAQTVADLEAGTLRLAKGEHWRALYALVRSVDRPAETPAGGRTMTDPHGSAGTATHRQEPPTGPRSGLTGAMRSTHAPAGSRQQHSGRPELERAVPVAGSPATACTVGGCVPPSLHGGPLGTHEPAGACPTEAPHGPAVPGLGAVHPAPAKAHGGAS